MNFEIEKIRKIYKKITKYNFMQITIIETNIQQETRY